MAKRTKSQLSLAQIREQVSSDQDFKKDVSGSDKTMLKLDHANNKTVLGDGTDITVEIAGSVAAAIAMGTNKITGMGDPTNAQDAATKAYVDSQLTGQDLDFQGDSGGALAIDLDSETLGILGGSDINTVGSGNNLTVDIDPTLETVTSVLNTSLVVGRDADNQVKFGVDNQISLEINTADRLHFKEAVIEPQDDDAMDLGSANKQFKDLYIDGVANIDSLVADTADIDGGTIDGAAIGGNSHSTGKFTTIEGTTSLTMPKQGGTHAISSFVVAADQFGASDSKLVTEAAIKGYVDAVASGVDAKESVSVATTQKLNNSFTYVNNGSSLSAPNSNTPNTGNTADFVGIIYGPEDSSIAIDGKLMNRVGMRVLIKDAMDISGVTEDKVNGIYEIQQVGGVAGQSKLEILVQNDGDGDYDANAGDRISFQFDGVVYEISFSTTQADSSSWSGTGDAPRTWNIRTNKSRAQMVTAIKTALDANPLGSNTSSATDSQSAGSSRTFRHEQGVGGDNGSALITKASSANDKEFELMEGEFNSCFKVYAYPRFAADARTVFKRAEDADGVDAAGQIMSQGSDLNPGAFTFVEEGNEFADCGFVMASDFEVMFQNEDPGVKFVQFSSAGTIGAGALLDKTGTTLDVDLTECQAQVIAHGDNLIFLDGGATGTHAKGSTADLAALFASGSDLSHDAGNSQLSITDNAVTLAKLEHGAQGDILAYGASGAPLRLSKGNANEVLIAGASDPAYGLIGNANIDAGAAIATSKLAADTISGKTLGGNLDALTATSGLELVGGGTYNGSAAKSIRLASGGIDQSALNSIEAYHIAASSLANNELLHGGGSGARPTFGESSSVASLNDLVNTVDNASVQSLNRSMCVQVYLNGQLLMPDQTGDHSASFTLSSADYKFYISGSDIRLKFNGDIVEQDDVIRITGMALS